MSLLLYLLIKNLNSLQSIDMLAKESLFIDMQSSDHEKKKRASTDQRGSFMPIAKGDVYNYIGLC